MNISPQADPFSEDSDKKETETETIQRILKGEPLPQAGAGSTYAERKAIRMMQKYAS